MRQIKINNFGAIKEGFNNDFLTINKVTVFLGNQGTGKSSVAKLISTMSWLEKQLYQDKLTEKEISRYNRFSNQYCVYHNLRNYFLTNTHIEYLGEHAHIRFNQKVEIKRFNKTYLTPKIMYIPAERSFLSSISTKNLLKIKELPQSLFTLLEELERAQMQFAQGLTLPIGHIQFAFDKLNKIAHLVGENYTLRLSEAASGFQSYIPLFLVSYYLTHQITQESHIAKNQLSIEDKKKLQAEIESILNNEIIAIEIKNLALEKLYAKYYHAECFFNIVEEIEQNLFPSAQQKLLYELLSLNNQVEGNQLVLTTHSPYIVNYLSLAIKAQALLTKIENLNSSIDLKKQLKERLNAVLPLKACIAANKVNIYEFTESGGIRELPIEEGLPSDNNYLNLSLADCNSQFNELLEIEELCE